MIRIDIRLHDGLLKALTMSGHASQESGARGNNLVCAAVSGLARSVGEAVATRIGITTDGQVLEDGNLKIQVLTVTEENRGWLDGVTAVLLAGAARMATEAPEDIDVTVEETRS